jgi:threonine/homoserine/homoserine lactone efflux protein
MSWSAALLGFAAVAGVLTIIPGLDTALVLRTALIQGRGRAFATALGILTGALLWGAGAAAGVSALLTASTIGYSIVRIAGAAYLVWLGCRFLRSAMATRPMTRNPNRRKVVGRGRHGAAGSVGC